MRFTLPSELVNEYGEIRTASGRIMKLGYSNLLEIKGDSVTTETITKTEEGSEDRVVSKTATLHLNLARENGTLVELEMGPYKPDKLNKLSMLGVVPDRGEFVIALGEYRRKLFGGEELRVLAFYRASGETFRQPDSRWINLKQDLRIAGYVLLSAALPVGIGVAVANAGNTGVGAIIGVVGFFGGPALFAGVIAPTLYQRIRRDVVESDGWRAFINKVQSLGVRD